MRALRGFGWALCGALASAAVLTLSAQAPDRAGGCSVKGLRVAEPLQGRFHDFEIALPRSAVRFECLRP